MIIFWISCVIFWKNKNKNKNISTKLYPFAKQRDWIFKIGSPLFWVRFSYPTRIRAVAKSTLPTLPPFQLFHPIKSMATASFAPLSHVFSRLSHISSSKSATSILPHSSPFKNSPNQLTFRREFLKGLALAPLIFISEEALPAHAREVEVGSYLPTSPSDPSFVLFKASPKDTPALRAGTHPPMNAVIRYLIRIEIIRIWVPFNSIFTMSFVIWGLRLLCKQFSGVMVYLLRVGGLDIH